MSRYYHTLFFCFVKTNSIFLYFVSKNPLTDAKALSGFRLHSLMLMEGVEDGLFFNFLQRFRKAFFFLRRFP